MFPRRPPQLRDQMGVCPQPRPAIATADFYEQIGLIEEARRSEAGYRVYSENDLHALRFVQRSRQLGFSIPEITALLALWRDRRRSSADVRQIALGHVADLRSKIAELQSIVDTLEDLADHCVGDSRPDCPILSELQGTGA